MCERGVIGGRVGEMAVRRRATDGRRQTSRVLFRTRTRVRLLRASPDVPATDHVNIICVPAAFDGYVMPTDGPPVRYFGEAAERESFTARRRPLSSADHRSESIKRTPHLRKKERERYAAAAGRLVTRYLYIIIQRPMLWMNTSILYSIE